MQDGQPADGGNIQRMRELADMISRSAPGMCIYDADGECEGTWLFTELPDPANALWPGGSGQIARMEPGQEFGLHAHYGCSEILVVICGMLEVKVNGRSPVMLTPSDPYKLIAGESHTARAYTEVLVVGITVPRDGGYPDGPAGPTEARSDSGVCGAGSAAGRGSHDEDRPSGAVSGNDVQS